jgi:hypothetical protein
VAQEKALSMRPPLQPMSDPRASRFLCISVCVSVCACISVCVSVSISVFISVYVLLYMYLMCISVYLKVSQSTKFCSEKAYTWYGCGFNR